MRRGSTTCKVPIRGLPGSTILACEGAIEKKGEDARKFIECREWKIGVNAKRFDHGERRSNSRDDVGSLVAVKLRGLEAHERAEGVDISGLGVDENTDGFDFFGKLGANLRGIGSNNSAQTFFVEIETERVGAGVGGSFGIG